MWRHFERETALRVAAIASLLLLITACNSTDQIRSSSPVRTGVFQGDYRMAAACASTRLYDGGRAAQTVIREQDRLALVVPPEHYTGLQEFEARLVEVSPQSFKVEVRSAQTVRGVHPSAEAAWTAIESCAAKA